MKASQWARMTPEQKAKRYAKAREWRAKNKDKVYQYNQAQYYGNREEMLRRTREYIQKRNAVDPAWKAANREKSRLWFLSPEGKAWRKRYRKFAGVRKKQREYSKAWSKANPDKWRAHSKVNEAIKAGKLIKQLWCSLCGVSDTPEKKAWIEAHHEDYTKFLEVIWLCRGCHVKIHPHTKKKR